MTGAASTVRVKDWLAGLPTPLVAVMVKGKLPWEVGVPARVAVPSPLSVKVTPVGSGPLSVREDVGVPVEVTVKLSGLPWPKVAPSADVIDGDWRVWSTVRVNVWVASGEKPLSASMVRV